MEDLNNMKSLEDILIESILDKDFAEQNHESKAALDLFEKMRAKYEMGRSRSKKYAMDMFGREIKVGDICFGYISMEFHFFQVKEIVEENGWFELVPTVDYKYIDGQGTVHPACAIIIPRKYYGEFLKVIK